jgi:hypothetical protein
MKVPASARTRAFRYAAAGMPLALTPRSGLALAINAPCG